MTETKQKTIPTEIKRAMASKDGMALLLSNYGAWARYTGIRGLAVREYKTDYVIQDETALLIDRALAMIKAERPYLYKILKFYYIDGKSVTEINKIFKSEQFIKDTGIKKFKYMQAYIISDIIKEGEQVILKKISHMAA